MTSNTKARRYRHALGEAIYRNRTERNLTLRELSLKAHVSLGHLSEVERGLKEVSSELLQSIADGLEIEIHELIIFAGYILGEYSGAFDRVPDDFSVEKKV